MMLKQFHGILLVFIINLNNAEPVKTLTSCLSGGNRKVLCVCDPSEMIHIISVLYQTATDNCQTVDGQCQLLQESSQEGLLPRCNGQQVCNETISDFKFKKKCGKFTALFVTLTYECIADTVMSVCSPRIVSKWAKPLYMMSPGYVNRRGQLPDISVCECELTGTEMSIEILEVNFLYDLQYRANLTLTGDNSSWSSASHFLVYNRIVMCNENTINVVFDARRRTGQKLWIKIQSAYEMDTRCNVDLILTTVSPELSSNRTVNLNQQNESNEGVIIGALCSLLVVMVIVAVALLVYLFRIRNESHKNDTVSLQMDDIATSYPGNNNVGVNDETGDELPSDIPTYTNLRSQSDPEHVYKSIKLSANTVIDRGNGNSDSRHLPVLHPEFPTNDNDQSSC